MAHAGCVGHFIVVIVVVDCVCMTLKSKSLLVIMMISKKNIRVDWMCISHSYTVCVNCMVFAKRP